MSEKTQTSTGFATCFKPLQPLIETAFGYGFIEGEFHKAFFTPMPKSVVEVRASNSNGAQRGKKIPLPSTPKIEQIIENVTAINASMHGNRQTFFIYI